MQDHVLKHNLETWPLKNNPKRIIVHSLKTLQCEMNIKMSKMLHVTGVLWIQP